MQSLADQELLRRFVVDRNEAAFAELVRRHLNLVWGAAFRITSDAEMAGDVSQLVFTDLAKKSGNLVSHKNLSGWLYRAATVAAQNTLRANVRRKNREKAAMELNNPGNNQSSKDDLLPLVDEALTALPEKDREILLLRFFSKKTFSQIAEVLALSEDTAQKRASRALEKLRGWFAARDVSLSSVTLSALLSAASAQAAPASMAVSISACAIASKTATPAIIVFGSKAAVTALAIALAVPILIQHQTLRSERFFNEQLRHQIVTRTVFAEQTVPVNESDELHRLRAEVATLKSEGREKSRNDLQAAQLELTKARERRLLLETQIAERERSVKTINALKQIGIAGRLFENDRNRMPRSLSEMKNELGQEWFSGEKLGEGQLSLDLFEVVQHERPITDAEPDMFFAWEKKPRKTSDGLYERGYVFVDGSAQMRAFKTPDFSSFETNHIARLQK